MAYREVETGLSFPHRSAYRERWYPRSRLLRRPVVIQGIAGLLILVVLSLSSSRALAGLPQRIQEP